MNDTEPGVAGAVSAMTSAAPAASTPDFGRLPVGLRAGVIGNSRIGALVDERGVVSWMCVPRFDGDPVFCSLLDDDSSDGRFAIEMENVATISQEYLRNTAILRTTMTDRAGQRLEVIDFCPRFYQHGRVFAPVSLVRMVRRISGRPRLRVVFAPRCNYGADQPAMTFGSHHIRAQLASYPLRLTTDAPITQVMERAWIRVTEDLTLILGPDETLTSGPRETGRRLFDETRGYWGRWVRNLAIPFEWQDAVIRAAITLKLNTFDDTGAIVASLTTSIPEAPGT
ncbi:MAG TPA: trehalase-like domain-containing protein, partial [Zeimonas sp.]